MEAAAAIEALRASCFSLLRQGSRYVRLHSECEVTQDHTHGVWAVTNARFAARARVGKALAAAGRGRGVEDAAIREAQCTSDKQGGLRRQRPSARSRASRRRAPVEPSKLELAEEAGAAPCPYSVHSAPETSVNHEQHGPPARGAAARVTTRRRAATAPTGHGAAPRHLRGPPEDGPRRATPWRQCVERAARRASAVQPKGRSAVRPPGRSVASRRPRLPTSAVRGPRRACPSADAEVRLGPTSEAELPQEAAGGLRRAAQSYFSWCRAAAA